MPLQPCLTCGRPSAGPRCADHAIDTRRMRDQPELRRAAAAVRAAARTCWICGGPFTASDPPTADHVTPLIAGGALVGELRPAHRSCNSRRGAQDGGEMEVPPPGLRIAPVRGDRSGIAASRSGGSTRIAGGAGGATTTDGVELAAQHTPGGFEKSLSTAEPLEHPAASALKGAEFSGLAVEADLAAAFERSGGGLLSMASMVRVDPAPADPRVLLLRVRAAVLGRRRLRAVG